MNNLKELFNKKNLKITIPVIVLLVLLIVVFIYLREYKYNNYRNKQTYDFYQYFAGEKFEYEATVSYNKKEVIKAFVPKEYTINYESIPIYYVDEKINKVIFPSIVSIILPIKNQRQYKIPEFSYIEKNNNIHNLTFEDYDTNIDHYVIFDGEELYFFADTVSFTINDEEITLSPLSYIIARANELKYYDYETDTFTTIQINEPVIVHSEYYEINVSYDSINYNNNKLLLTSDFNRLGLLKESTK